MSYIAWDHGYGYVKESRIVKFIAKYVGKPYKELAKAWNEWIKPIKNTDKTEYLDDYFTDYRWRQAFFRVDDNGTPVELPVYHVRDARDYIRWWLDGKQGRLPGTREVVKVDTYQQLFRPGTHAYEQAVKFDNNWVYLPIPCSKGGYIGETSKHFMHLETEQIPNPRYAEIQSSLDALTKSVEDIEAGITVTFSDGVTPVTMEYLTNEINNAHYRLSITSRCITVNHGYGQLYPLVKRIDYERTIQEMARETGM